MILTILGILAIILLVIFIILAIILVSNEYNGNIPLEKFNYYKDSLESVLRWINRQEDAMGFPLYLPEEIKQLFRDNGFKVDVEEINGSNYIVARKEETK